MLLKFIYVYMKLNREDIFYNELAWYYTFEDIEKIVNLIWKRMMLNGAIKIQKIYYPLKHDL